MSQTRRSLLAALAASPFVAGAQAAREVDRSAKNLMLVVRESINGNFSSAETLQYIGRGRVKTNDGKEHELELAHYAFLGDVHIRFVFDSPTHMENAQAADISKLGLTPSSALTLAISNMRREYGEARKEPVHSGLFQLDSKSPDFISSYFLDAKLWEGLEARHPGGLVAVVPRRGGVLYTPASNVSGVNLLKQAVSGLFKSSGNLRVSSAVFMFKEGRWVVLQDPIRKE